MSLSLDLDNKWSYLKTHGSAARPAGRAGRAAHGVEGLERSYG